MAFNTYRKIIKQVLVIILFGLCPYVQAVEIWDCPPYKYYVLVCNYTDFGTQTGNWYAIRYGRGHPDLPYVCNGWYSGVNPQNGCDDAVTHFTGPPDVTSRPDDCDCGLNSDDVQPFIDSFTNGDFDGFNTPDDWQSWLSSPVDEDNDGVDDRWDKDCPLHNEYRSEIGEILFGEDVGPNWGSIGDSGDDPLDYELWQNDHDQWLANWQTGRLLDSDGDGFSDGWEDTHGFDPQDANSKAPGRGDLEGDIFNPNDKGDGNWRLRDSDGDGYTDGLEWDRGYNWNDNSDHPCIEIPPDYPDGDYDGDGESNQNETDPPIPPATHENPDPVAPPPTNPTDPLDHHTGYSPGGYVGDGTGDTNQDAPTDDETFGNPDDYEPGEYTLNPGNFVFGDDDYDDMLNRFGKVRGDWESLRPDSERDFCLTFRIPIPGLGEQEYTFHLIPQTSTPWGSALDQFRKWVRMLFVALMTYWLIRNVWLTLRQY